MSTTTDTHDILAMLHDSAERSLAELSTKEAVNAAETGTWPKGLWDTIEGLGFTRAALPESAEGSGLDLGAALTLARIAAMHAAPVPLGETLVAGWLLAQAGLPVPTGPLTFGPVDRRAAPTLARTADGWTLDGSVHGLPWGAMVRRVALLLQGPDGPVVASVDPAHGRATTRASLAGEPRTRLDFQHAALAAEDVAPLPATLGLADAGETAQVLGAILRAQQMAGALQRACDLAVRYANERIAFGKPLSRLQAVQQNLAVLAGQTAAARVAADMALGALTDALTPGQTNGPVDLLASAAMAKVRVGEAAGIGAQLAHQAHGAIGFTYEHMLHHATRRLYAWRDEFGNEAYWSVRLGERMTAAGDAALWDFVTRAARL